MSIARIQTTLLEISYDVGGPPGGPPVLLLHGWPDDIRGWCGVAPLLQSAGYRTIAPYLRGFGSTCFRSPETPRDARGVALAQDAIDLADALGISSFAVVGHDWGARAAYTLAALFPDRISSVVGIALAYQPRAEFKVPAFSQARRFWYQWLMTLDQGAEAVREDPQGFARIQWDTWSPPGWFDEAEFDATAESFLNPDWTAITLNAYRGRWRQEPRDPCYDDLQRRLESVEILDRPTLMIQGGSDFCDEPASSEGMEKFFSSPYSRLVLNNVGHFPPREAPRPVAEAILAHLEQIGRKNEVRSPKPID
jgi:pimeloyl-ACP methyl ester carboxylesterase